ncbi:MAG: hypothetical protein IJ567_07920 [Lachnospiraceae bacterium]|nr:hypothetical protein [Lachnospiraceae bacterium]
MDKATQKEHRTLGGRGKRAIAWVLALAMVVAAGNLPSNVVEVLAIVDGVTGISAQAPTVKSGLIYNGSSQYLVNPGTDVTSGTEITVTTGESITFRVVSGGAVSDKKGEEVIAAASAASSASVTVTGSGATIRGITAKWEYRLGNQSAFSEALPEARNAGTYTVDYRLVASNGMILDSYSGQTVTIAKAEVVLTPSVINSTAKVGDALKEVVINGTGQKAVIKGTNTAVGGTWSWVNPAATLTEMGTYEARFTPDDTANYVQPATVKVTVTAQKQTPGSTDTGTTSGSSSDSGSAAATVVTGWVQNADGTWSYNENGKATTGWQEINGTWYHMDRTGTMETGWLRINGTWYYMNNDGAMETGWVEVNGTWYYTNESGALQTGWIESNGTWYYTNDNGEMQTGWIKGYGAWYYTGASGALETGWVNDNGTWYYTDGSGAMQTGWLNLNGTWYYTDHSGAMQTGWQRINATWYYLDASGAMQTGWFKDGNSWYYLNAGGAMQTGWYQVGGKWYYSYASGAMAANTHIGSYNINASGEWVR